MNENTRSNKSSRFDVLELSLKRPVEFAAKGLFLVIIGIPVACGFVWGISTEGNLFGVIGVAARRLLGSSIKETEIVGKMLRSFNR